MKKLSLMRYFTIYSLLAFAMTGFVLVAFISNHMKAMLPYDEIKTHLWSLNRNIIAIIFSGLLVLFVLLIGIIRNASNTLVMQNKALLSKTIELEESYTRLNTSYKSTVVALSRAVDARDKYTAGHSERVAGISLQIGTAMGLSDKQLETLEIAALFHDIGKLGIPDHILLKPERLTDAEFGYIKEHPQIGVNILASIDFFKDALSIILHHHERFDGKGYPSNNAGQYIPVESRIIAVADTYDAITSDRPYRKGLSQDIALDEILKHKGTQFDSQVVDAFMEIASKIKAAV